MIFTHYVLLVLFGVDHVVSRLQSHQRFNLNIWAMAPYSSMEVLLQSSTWPSKHDDYYVTNLGKLPVWAELKYGTAISWNGLIVGVLVQPGETTHLSNLGESYFNTGLRVNNDVRERAFVRVIKASGTWRTSQIESNYKVPFDVNEFAQFIATTIAGNIPMIGTTLANTIAFFWPSSPEENVWEKVRDKVEQVVDKKVSSTIKALLNGQLRSVGKKIRALDRALKSGIKGSNITNHYMNVAQDLIGIEEAFRFSKGDDIDYNKMNYAVLPLYSNLLTMKMLFYRMATLEKEHLGMTDATLAQVRFYTHELMLDGAFEHIPAVMEERLQYTYDTCNAENMFDQLITVRTYCTVNGLESIPLWEHWVNNPGADVMAVYNDVVTFSTYMGRPTKELYIQADSGNMGPMLHPKRVEATVEGKSMQIRDKLVELKIRYSDDYIYAITATYKNRKFEMGNFEGGNKNMLIQFHSEYLKRLEAFGDDSVEGLKLLLSNGKEYKAGRVGGSMSTVFELKLHHISAVFAGNDTERGEDRIVNIAVSYMMDNKLNL